MLCFKQNDFVLYLFIIICIFAFFIYIYSSAIAEKKEQLYELKQKQLLHSYELKQKQEQKPQEEIKDDIKVKFLEKIYNPLVSPETIYPGGNLRSRSFDAYQNYQMLGYLSGNNDQYSVFGRYKYPGKTDKYEYYTINNSRSHIKIPFKTNNYDELYDGDVIDIPDISNGLVFRKYETEELRYNPNVF